jgi:uncharacterized protein YyaL (SSP411 family)
MGHAAPFMLSVLSAWHAGMAQVVVAETDDVSASGALLDVLARTYLPFAVTVRRPAAFETARWRDRLPFVAAMQPVRGHPTAYVCRDFACQEPVTTAEALAGQLHARAAVGSRAGSP